MLALFLKTFMQKLRDTVGLKFDKKFSGKTLQDMGYRIDSDGYLIAATLKYGVMNTIPRTIVFIKDTPKTKKKSKP
jgi:hypothetical protein